MEDFKKLYDCIKDVIATDEELNLNLGCVRELKKAYKNINTPIKSVINYKNNK
jgi:hypothetical protein|tara:strand:- start:67 stop:225 length:159 start_codon:yes stop_codon:yes gene_type:complete